MRLKKRTWYNKFMTIHQIFTLSDSATTRLTPLGTHSGMDITVQNVNSSGYIYIGGENVSSSSYGFRILPNHAISFELAGEDSLFAIASVDDLNIAVIKIGLESQD